MPYGMLMIAIEKLPETLKSGNASIMFYDTKTAEV